VRSGRIDRRSAGFVLAGILWLAAGFALQLAVYSRGGHSALSDLPRVFLHRGVDSTHLPYLDRVVEYPVGAGLLLYAAALVRSTPLGVLTVTAAASGALALWTGVALRRVAGGRAWRWMIGPPLLVYAFQNWDVFAIAAMVAGLLAYRRARPGTAGALLGVGAVVKLFPIVVVPVLVADRLGRGDRAGAARLAGAAAAVVAAVNLPFAIADTRAWLWPAAFQGRRFATWGSVWPYLNRWLHVPVGTAPQANLVSFVVLGGGLLLLVVLTARGRLDWTGAAAAAVVLFVLANKVYSPTYDLWLVPFFVLLPVPRRLWTAFWVVDLGVYLTVFGYFHGQVGRGVVDVVLPVLVAVRVVVLIGLVVVAARRDGAAPVTAARAGAPGWLRFGLRRREPAVGVS
jgi:hypothetical protein